MYICVLSFLLEHMYTYAVIYILANNVSEVFTCF